MTTITGRTKIQGDMVSKILTVDTLNEQTPTAGVMVDGGLLKDGAFEGIVESKCIDIVQLSNLDIVATDTDALTFDFVPSKIVIEYNAKCVGADDCHGHTNGQAVITITGTNTFTSNMNCAEIHWDARTNVKNIQTDRKINDTTNILYFRGGLSDASNIGEVFATGVWNTAGKTLTLTYSQSGTLTTAATFVALIATAYK